MLQFIGEHINELLNIVLGLIMFGLGMGLKKNDFKQLFDQPRALTIGLTAQMVLLPLVGFILVSYSNLNPEFKVGVMLLSICPGGITSNLVSYFVKGNIALAVSLTVTNAIFSLFTIPLLVNQFLHYFLHSAQNGDYIQLPFFKTVLSIFMVTILPAMLGMMVRYKLGKKIVFVQKYINIALPILLLLVFAFKFLGGNGQNGSKITIDEILELTPIVIGLNVGAMYLGFLVGTPFGLSFKNRITIAVEVGLHNTALALLIASEKLGMPQMEKPALVYAMYSFFVTYVIAWSLVRVRLQRFKKRS